MIDTALLRHPLVRERIRELPGFLRALPVALAGGGGATLLGLPAAWMCGGAILVALVALFRRNLGFPNWLVTPTYTILGAAMGSTVEAGMLDAFDQPFLSLAALVGAIAGVTGAGFLVLRYLAGWERETAFLSAVPGALAYCVALASDSKTADVPQVALSQTSRLILLVAVIPLLVTASAGGDVSLTPPVRAPSPLGDVAILLACCSAGLWLAHRLRLPAHFITGPFLTSLALHLTGFSHAHIPQWLIVPAYVLMGCNIGVRFGRADPRMILRSVLPTLGSFGLAVLVALGLAELVAPLAGVSVMQAFLAFAPGGIDAMAVLALAMHMDAAFVVLHQVARFLLLTVFLSLGAKLFLPSLRRPATPEAEPDPAPAPGE